jgi:hypothetical protein
MTITLDSAALYTNLPTYEPRCCLLLLFRRILVNLGWLHIAICSTANHALPSRGAH